MNGEQATAGGGSALRADGRENRTLRRYVRQRERERGRGQRNGKESQRRKGPLVRFSYARRENLCERYIKEDAIALRCAGQQPENGDGLDEREDRSVDLSIYRSIDGWTERDRSADS